MHHTARFDGDPRGGQGLVQASPLMRTDRRAVWLEPVLAGSTGPAFMLGCGECNRMRPF